MGTYSKLHEDTYQRIKSKYPEFVIQENRRPEWLMSSKLTRLEIDIYIETLDTAIEIQGIQHYEYTPHFHKSYDDFLDQRRRDEEKRELCEGHNTKLVEIACYADLSNFMYDLDKMMQSNNLNPEADPVKSYFSKPHKTKMRNINYRRWKNKIRIKKLKAKLERQEPKIKPILEGSDVQKRYARRFLKYEQIGDAIWKVWGGRDEHIIVQTADFFTCDCQQFIKTGKICSHIIRVKYATQIEASIY